MPQLHNFKTFEDQLAASPAPVIDNSISVSGISTWKHHIMANFYDWIRRISSGIPHLGSKDFMLNDVQLLDLFKTKNNDISVHFTFDVNDDSFFGTFDHLNHSQTPRFSSEIKSNSEYSPQFVKRLESLLLRIILKIIEPDLGIYEVNERLLCINQIGQLRQIQPGSRIKVSEVSNSFPKTINFDYNGEKYRTRIAEYWSFKEKCAMVEPLVKRTPSQIKQDKRQIAVF